MVVVNVPKLHARKLHALVGILAATAAFPSGCSGGDFEGCEASRTCPPKGGEAGGGTGGESGGGNDTGGNAGAGRGGNSGSGGTSGTDDGGEGGTSGSGGSGDDDTEAPTIVSVTPGDGDVDVERDVTVTVEFSEAIDAESVTETSVVLTGPDGDVTGTLGVDENVVTFTAEKKLYLLGDYTVTIDETIVDLAGNTLEAGESVGFRVRDGRWSEPVYPFGETVPRWVEGAQRNTHGDVVVGVTNTSDPRHVYGAVYSAEDNQWAVSDELDEGLGTSYQIFGIGIGLKGHAVVTWCPFGSGSCVWSRFTDTWQSANALGVDRIAVTSDGSATAVFWDATLMGYFSRTQNLSTGTVAQAAPVPIPSGAWIFAPVSSLERVALIASRPATTGQEIVVMWKDGNAWSLPEPLGQTVEYPHYFADSDEEGNIIFVWTDGDEIWSRIFQRAEEEWTRPLIIASTSPGPILLPPDITAGNAIVAFNTFDPDPSTWAAIYEAGVGWIENSIVRIDADWTGGSVGATIDPRGNGFAVWRPELSTLKFRRYIAGDGWKAVSQGEDRINPYMLWSASAPDGSVLAVATDSDEMESNRVPWVKRFE